MQTYLCQSKVGSNSVQEIIIASSFENAAFSFIRDSLAKVCLKDPTILVSPVSVDEDHMIPVNPGKSYLFKGCHFMTRNRRNRHVPLPCPVIEVSLATEVSKKKKTSRKIVPEDLLMSITVFKFMRTESSLWEFGIGVYNKKGSFKIIDGNLRVLREFWTYEPLHHEGYMKVSIKA